MKKIPIYLLALILMGSANAQFNVEVGLNSNTSTGNFKNTHTLGLGGYVEPSYTFAEKLQVGLYAGVIFLKGKGSEKSIIESSNLNTYLITGTYRFPEMGGLSPYAGLGVGVFDTEFVEIDDGGSDIDVGVYGGKGGFMSRFGMNYQRYNLGMAYNFVEDGNFLQINLGVRLFNN